MIFFDEWRLFGFLFILYTLLDRHTSTYTLNEKLRDLLPLSIEYLTLKVG